MRGLTTLVVRDVDRMGSFVVAPGQEPVPALSSRMLGAVRTRFFLRTMDGARGRVVRRR